MSNVPSHSRTRRSHRRTLSAGQVGSRRTHGDSAYLAGITGAEEVYEQIAVDESGQVTAGGIAPGAVTGAAFASTVAPVLLVHGLPTLPNPSYPIDVFVYDIDAAPKRLYKNVADVWVSAIGPDDIQANSITAGQIAAGAVSTSELAVGARLTGELANESGVSPGVFIDSTGILIRDGKLVLEDEFGLTTLGASGFSGSWADFVTNGLYNSALRAGVVGTIPNGRTAALPYWTLANGVGSPVATFLSGGGVKITFAALNNQKTMRSDLIAVSPGRSYEVIMDFDTNTPGTTDVHIVLSVGWYDSGGGLLAASTLVDTVIPGGLGVTSWALRQSTDTLVGAYYAAVGISVTEETAHSASAYATVKSMAMVPSNEAASRLRVAESVYIDSNGGVSPELSVDGDATIGGVLQLGTDVELQRTAAKTLAVDSSGVPLTLIEIDANRINISRSDGVSGTTDIYLTSPTSSNSAQLYVQRDGDTTPRSRYSSEGIEFGPGNAARDVVLSRTAANVLSLASGDVLAVAGTQVVTSRRTGWTAPTGTAQRGTFATDTVTLINLARAVKALIDDLTTHGLIGA